MAGADNLIAAGIVTINGQILTKEQIAMLRAIFNWATIDMHRPGVRLSDEERRELFARLIELRKIAFGL